jgi:hypothetical protein
MMQLTKYQAKAVRSAAASFSREAREDFLRALTRQLAALRRVPSEP